MVYTIPGFLHHREQEEDLDDLSETIMRLGAVGLTIHEELSSQVLHFCVAGSWQKIEMIQMEVVAPCMMLASRAHNMQSEVTVSFLISFSVLHSRVC